MFSIEDPNLRFRQRSGNINWHALSSCDLNKIFKGNVEQLQKVLDNLTFSEFSSIDVKAQSIENVSKLVNIMQLIIEYLLYSQERSFRNLKSKLSEIKALKKENSNLEKTTAFYKEDRKTYQRQLNFLRKSLSKAQEMVKYPEDIIFASPEKGSRIVFDPKEKWNKENIQVNPSNSPTSIIEQFNPLIDSIIEKQNQYNHIFKEALVDQRTSFLSELNALVKSCKVIFEDFIDTKTSNKTDSDSSNTIDKKTTLKSISIQTSIDEISYTKNVVKTNPIQDILVAAANDSALDEKKYELERIQENLEKQRIEISLRESALVIKEKNIQDISIQLDMDRSNFTRERKEFSSQKAKSNEDAFSEKVEKFVKLGSLVADTIPKRKWQRVALSHIFSNLNRGF